MKDELSKMKEFACLLVYQQFSKGTRKWLLQAHTAQELHKAYFDGHER
jgi:hypothetical protein